jgi:hypothetical protein
VGSVAAFAETRRVRADGIQQREVVRRAEWLHQILVRARFQRVRSIRRVTAAAGENDLGAAPGLTARHDAAADLIAVHPRHEKFAHDHVGLLLQRGADAFLAAARVKDIPARFRERLGECGLQSVVAIYQEDALHSQRVAGQWQGCAALTSRKASGCRESAGENRGQPHVLQPGCEREHANKQPGKLPAGSRSAKASVLLARRAGLEPATL